MRAEDIPETTFTTRCGEFKFCVIPFGLFEGPSTFQHMMDAVFPRPAELPNCDTVFFRELWLPILMIFASSRVLKRSL